MRKGSSYKSTRILCRPRRWPFCKDVALLRRAARGGYDPLSRYWGLALRNALLVYIPRLRKYAVALSHKIKHTYWLAHCTCPWQTFGKSARASAFISDDDPSNLRLSGFS